MSAMARYALLFLVLFTLPAKAEVSLTGALRAQLSALPALQDRVYTGAENRVTLVTFFASWCPPCRDEFAVLNKIRREFSESELDIVAINLFEDFSGLSNPHKLKRFLKQTAPRFPTLKGNNDIGKIFENVQRIPTVFIFDQSGRKRLHFVHLEGATKMSLTFDELSTALAELL